MQQANHELNIHIEYPQRCFIGIKIFIVCCTIYSYVRVIPGYWTRSFLHILQLNGSFSNLSRLLNFHVSIWHLKYQWILVSYVYVHSKSKSYSENSRIAVICCHFKINKYLNVDIFYQPMKTWLVSRIFQNYLSKIPMSHLRSRYYVHISINIYQRTAHTISSTTVTYF